MTTSKPRESFNQLAAELVDTYTTGGTASRKAVSIIFAHPQRGAVAAAVVDFLHRRSKPYTASDLVDDLYKLETA